MSTEKQADATQDLVARLRAALAERDALLREASSVHYLPLGHAGEHPANCRACAWEKRRDALLHEGETP